MKPKTPLQLDAEIAVALAKGAPLPSPTTVAGWKQLIAVIQTRARTSDSRQREVLQQLLSAASDGLRAAQKTAAHKPTYVTGTNLFALTQLVVKHGGPEFSNRLEAVDRPHIKRCLDAGLVEIFGTKLRLTPEGRTAVADELVKDITRESSYTPKENALVPADARAEVLAKDIAKRDANVQLLENALASLSR